MNRNISKALWTLGSLIGAQQVAKFARNIGDVEWNDVLGVLKVQGLGLDHAYLREWARELKLTDLLESALDDAGLPLGS